MARNSVPLLQLGAAETRNGISSYVLAPNPAQIYPASMSPKFTAFNEYAPVEIYYRNLPHWHQNGATCFVTFRLADSIPRTVLEQWNHERTQWLEARGITDRMERKEREAAYGKIDPKHPPPVYRTRPMPRMLPI